jgi:hypothetical protein
MPRSNESGVDQPAPAVPRPARVFRAPPDLEQELLQAMQDFERGDYIELTVEQLEHCAATGESPWPDESPS